MSAQQAGSAAGDLILNASGLLKLDGASPEEAYEQKLRSGSLGAPVLVIPPENASKLAGPDGRNS